MVAYQNVLTILHFIRQSNEIASKLVQEKS